MSIITEKLDILIQLIERQGFPIRSQLEPGLSRSEIERKTKELSFQLPEELYELYQWHNGQGEETYFNVPLFRDTFFISLEQAIEEYEVVQDFHDGEEEDFLMTSFPFSSFEGEWYILLSDSHPFQPQLERPVISIFEGIDVMYLNISTMLETLSRCFSEGAYQITFDQENMPISEVNHGLERTILKALNPRIY